MEKKYKVKYGTLWVCVHAGNKENAFWLGITMLGFKYPNLKELDTDSVEVEEVVE